MDLLQGQDGHGLGRLSKITNLCGRAALRDAAQSASQEGTDLRALCTGSHKINRKLQRERRQGGAHGREVLREGYRHEGQAESDEVRGRHVPVPEQGLPS